MKFFQKNKKIRIVISCLILITILSTYFYGYRVLLLLGLNLFLAAMTEFLFSRKTKLKVPESVLVTAMLYTLTLPPKIPFELSATGIVFGVFFGKCIFGGYGYNIFNPALVGRVFLHISFTKYMTVMWTKPISGGLAGFTEYLGKPISAVSSATPMLAFRWTGAETDLIKLFLGNITGSLGETSALLLILLGLFLMYKKIISKAVVFSILGSFATISTIAYFIDGKTFMNPVSSLLTGGLLLGTLFMATEPITAPKTLGGKIVIGILVGLITFTLRYYSLFTGGMMFAILIGNMFTPILDIAFSSKERRLENV